MNRIKRIGLSMGTMCLASVISTSSAFATNPNQNPTRSTHQNVSGSQVSNAARLEAEFSRLQSRFSKQLKLLEQATNALATAQKMVSKLKTDEYDSDIEDFKQDCLNIEASLERHSKKMHMDFSRTAKEIIKQCEELLGPDDE